MHSVDDAGAIFSFMSISCVRSSSMGNESGEEGHNQGVFVDCLFNAIVNKYATTSPSGKKGKASPRSKATTSKEVNNPAATETDPSELADFSDYLANEIFPSFPEELRGLSHQSLQENSSLDEKWSLPLSLSTFEELAELVPGSVDDSLTAYGLIQPPKTDTQSFLSPIISSYVATVTTPPPKWIATKATACEMCDRDWVPLTYHHLIPKQVHAKVLKRGWHEEQQLNSVAWLCRACHSFVHSMASNEELARDWYTVERICSRDDVQKWAQWVGRVRWKKT